MVLEDLSLQAIVGMDVDSNENMAIALQTTSAPNNKDIMMYDVAGVV